MKLEDLIIILICSFVLFFWFVYVIYFFAERRALRKAKKEAEKIYDLDKTEKED